MLQKLRLLPLRRSTGLNMEGLDHRIRHDIEISRGNLKGQQDNDAEPVEHVVNGGAGKGPPKLVLVRAVCQGHDGIRDWCPDAIPWEERTKRKKSVIIQSLTGHFFVKSNTYLAPIMMGMAVLTSSTRGRRKKTGQCDAAGDSNKSCRCWWHYNDRFAVEFTQSKKERQAQRHFPPPNLTSIVLVHSYEKIFWFNSLYVWFKLRKSWTKFTREKGGKRQRLLIAQSYNSILLFFIVIHGFYSLLILFGRRKMERNKKS